MKQYTRWYAWPLTAMILILALAACKSAKQSEDATTDETKAVTETETTDKASEVLDAVYPPAKPLDMEGAITTESGLQYVELVPGDGPAPQDGDIITMHFVASLSDGTVLSNTYEQGEPAAAVFGRNQLLPGWEEGIGLMKAGGKMKLILPPELAFGEEGYGSIPPNSPIIIEVELISVAPPPAPTNVSADEMITTDSGLQYYDITVGDGPEAVESDTVTTHFTIWVRGDTEDTYIGSSNNREPITFVLGEGDTVFPGWDEGVTNMKQGGKRLLVIPPELAMGEEGAGDIPPNATLMMEVELVGVREAVKMTEVVEEDYIHTDSGLKYYDIVEGDGPMPTEGQTVVVHYTGWLEDGTQFDSSLDRGQPFTFSLGAGSVISGWDEGVATMKVGGKRQLVIPPELGYGDTGAGGVIPPGATLIFEVELLDIQQ